MKKDYQIKIKIKGEGTPKEVVESLLLLAEEIGWEAENNGSEAFDDQQWEDPTLMTEIDLIY